MYTRELKKIRQYLDSIPGTEGDTADPQLYFDLVEEAAISVHESQYMDFPLDPEAEAEAEPGLLFCYLETYLQLRRLEYGLEPDPWGA